jgi:hypothetical protein
MKRQEALQRQVSYLRDSLRKMRILNSHVTGVGLTGIESTLESLQIEIFHATEEIECLISNMPDDT